MTADLQAALARSIATANGLLDKPEAEPVDDVFTVTGDVYQRFNSTWRDGLRRESKESSP